jgi:hypothetical protein
MRGFGPTGGFGSCERRRPGEKIETTSLSTERTADICIAGALDSSFPTKAGQQFLIGPSQATRPARVSRHHHIASCVRGFASTPYNNNKMSASLAPVSPSSTHTPTSPCPPHLSKPAASPSSSGWPLTTSCPARNVPSAKNATTPASSTGIPRVRRRRPHPRPPAPLTTTTRVSPWQHHPIPGMRRALQRVQNLSQQSPEGKRDLRHD